MLFSKKIKQKQGRKEEDGLYPVLYMTDSLKEYQKDLVGKEVESLRDGGQLVCRRVEESGSFS